MCTRIFGTAILVKNFHIGGRRERNNVHDPFAVAVLLLSAIYQEQYWLPIIYSLDEQDLQKL